MHKRDKRAQRADKRWASVYLRQMLMRDAKANLKSDRPTIPKENKHDVSERKNATLL